MLGAGMSEWLTDLIIELYDVQRAGHMAEVSPVVEQVAGRKPISFAQFAKVHDSLQRKWYLTQPCSSGCTTIISTSHLLKTLRRCNFASLMLAPAAARRL